MQLRRRVVAFGSAAALVGALGVGVTVTSVAASSGSESGYGSGVTFSSQPGVATLITHYVVSPAGHEEKASTSASPEENRSITLSPKGDRNGSSKAATSGVNSSSNVPDTHASDNSSTRSPSSSFMGQQSSATTCSYFVGAGCNPPDMALGSSPQFVLQGVNTQWEVLDTKGKVQPGWPVSAQDFFGVKNVTSAHRTPCDTAHLSQPFLSDPRALYDPIDKRFWAAMLQVESGLGLVTDGCPFKSVYYVSVSQTSNPNGKWNVYEFEMSMGQPFAADYTQLGINGDAVYFSANMFGPVTDLNGGHFQYAELFEANKARMEKGQGGFTADGFYNLRAAGPGITASTGPFLSDTVQPAANLDGSAGGSEVFVNTLDGPDPVNGHFCGFLGGGFEDSCSGMALWKMTNPIAHDRGGPAPTFTGTYVATKPFLVSAPADQPSCKQCIDVLDLRVTGTPVVRNGIVYAAWETAINNRSQVVPGIEWVQVSLSDRANGDSSRSENSSQNDYYNFSGDAAATFGAVMPDAKGNLLMLFEHMSNTVFPETRYIVKSANQDNFKGPGVLLKAGEMSYRPPLCGSPSQFGPVICRWGDFEAASFDGTGHIWFAGQYANLVVDAINHGRNWGTWIGSINAS
jgi:hypothetical protein